jgi:hypothetical protein
MSAEPLPRNRSRSLATASAVFLVLLGLYLVTFQDEFRVDDEHIFAARAQSLALWGRLEQPQVFGNQRERELQAMGAAATQIEPGQAVLGAGLYRAAMALGWGGAQTLFLQNAVLTALTGATLVLSVEAMGFSPGVGVAVALFFGLGTFAWPYATTYFRDPLAMFGAAVAFHGWIRVTRPGQGRIGAGWLVLLAGIGVAVGAKNSTLVLVPAFGVMLPLAAHRAPSRWRRHWMAWAAGAALLAVLLVLLPKPGPLARFTLGYYLSVAQHFLGSLDGATLIAGTLGPFVSPARSLFLFCPPLFLLLAAPRRWWREQALVAGAILLAAFGLALAQVLFYRQQWAGAVGWGPRAMLPVLPAMMLLTASGIDRLRGAAAGRWILAGVAALAAVVQLSAVLIPWQTAYESIRIMGLDAYTYAGAWDIRRLLPLHQIAWLLRPEAWDLAWTRLARAGLRDWLVPLVAAFSGAVGGCLLLWRPTRRAWPTMVIAGCACLTLLAATAGSLNRDPAWFADVEELRQAQAYVEGRLAPTDVVLLDAYGTPAWFRMMATWKSNARWYSLPFEIPGTEGSLGAAPQPDVVRLMEDLLAGGGRIWLIASSAAPDTLEADERTWLAEHGHLESARSFEGPALVEVQVFTPLRP